MQERTRSLITVVSWLALLALPLLATPVSATASQDDRERRPRLRRSTVLPRVPLLRTPLSPRAPSSDAPPTSACVSPIPRDAIPCTSESNPCEPGSTCIDDDDDCDPAVDGDCPGLCVQPVNASCSSDSDCPPGFECHDDPFDDCDPDCEGVDCPTVCLRTDGDFCMGFAGTPCPDGPFLCVDFAGDDCSPDCPTGPCADGIGLCIRTDELFAQPCGGAECETCPDGATCIDDPFDDCDPSRGDADCPGICVIIVTSSADI